MTLSVLICKFINAYFYEMDDKQKNELDFHSWRCAKGYDIEGDFDMDDDLVDAIIETIINDVENHVRILPITEEIVQEYLDDPPTLNNELDLEI